MKKLEFWVKTSRMLDRSEIVAVREDADEDDIKDLLEDWCRHQFDFDRSGSRISYGWKDQKD